MTNCLTQAADTTLEKGNKRKSQADRLKQQTEKKQLRAEGRTKESFGRTGGKKNSITVKNVTGRRPHRESRDSRKRNW